MNVIQRIAEELSVSPHQVSAAVALLDQGATVPFIARYRKELTRGLDDGQLRTLQERLFYLRDLNERRNTILESIRGQGKLTPELEKAIQQADNKTHLEDLYLPYKPKRHSKAQIAREAGLEPLADFILSHPDCDPFDIAGRYINPEKAVTDAASALDGARQIIMERISENAVLLAELREYVWNNGFLQSSVIKNQEQAGIKFRDYFGYQEAIKKIPSHRALALFRGRKQDILSLKLMPARDGDSGHRYCEQQVIASLNLQNTGKPAAAWLAESARLTWKVKLFTRINLDLLIRLREAAEQEAIQVFAHNLRNLLLTAPAGARVTMGLDPGLRTGVKAAVVDATGKLLDTATLYPHVPKRQWQEAITILVKLIKQYRIELISIGNGTGSRETDQLVGDLMQQHPDLNITKLVVSEAGASVYSASELGAKEFPDLDVSLRGAVSIARRLQDPLAELVKIEPKAIGVGQYQHDVNQVQLGRQLNHVIEDCVNAVGVDVNTASVALLTQVSGLSATVSQNIVNYRDQHGPFKNRGQLKNIPRLGQKTFEQAAGFLRISNGDNPLDASAVHPEAYPVVQSILDDTGKSIQDLIGQSPFLRKLDAANYTNEIFGLPTVTDILQELEKPGRDPRPEFKTASFKEGVEKITDLKVGMYLEGVVTNVANFGAFVDIGVHQDGLVHISQLADTFVKDPHTVVKTGATVKVRVLDVDIVRNRINLSMKKHTGNKLKPHKNRPVKQNPIATSGMAKAFAKALKNHPP